MSRAGDRRRAGGWAGGWRGGRGLPDALCPQAPELSREEKLQLRKEKKQQKKKKRTEKGLAAEPPELGTPSDPGQPRGEDLLIPEAAPEPGEPRGRAPQHPQQRQPCGEAPGGLTDWECPQAGTALSRERPPVRGGHSGTSGMSHLSASESSWSSLPRVPAFLQGLRCREASPLPT